MLRFCFLRRGIGGQFSRFSRRERRGHLGLRYLLLLLPGLVLRDSIGSIDAGPVGA